MAESLTAITEQHRNQLRDESPWVWLYEIEVPSDPVTRIRLTNYSEDVYFGLNSSGEPIRYVRFPIVHGGIRKTASGDIPTMEVAVANVSLEISRFVELYGGLIDAPAVIRVVNMADIANPRASIEERAEVRAVRVRSQVASFTLSAYSLYRLQIPSDRYTALDCRFRYGSAQCGYVIPATPGETIGTGFSTCPRTFSACGVRGADELARGVPVNHPRRFGGAPAIPRALGGA